MNSHQMNHYALRQYKAAEDGNADDRHYGLSQANFYATLAVRLEVIELRDEVRELVKMVTNIERVVWQLSESPPLLD